MALCTSILYLYPLFKSLARAGNKVMTINDVLVTAICDVVLRYFETVGYKGEGPIHFITPLAVPIKYPAKYLDETEGLNSQFCLIGHRLPLVAKTEKNRSFRDLLDQMHHSF